MSEDLSDAGTFAWLERELLKRGFVALSDAQFRANFRRLGLVAPRPRKGREAGFKFSANGLTVWVWTTWLRFEGQERDVDSGWIVIAQGDTALYFSHPLYRTKNFFLNLFRQAWIARYRVARRPHCELCGKFMDIVRGRNLKERYWRCDRISNHSTGRPTSRRWDFGLPPKAQEYVDKLRERRQTYEKKLIAQGKKPHQAMLKRKPWRRKPAGGK